MIVPWKDHKALLQDEENAKALREHNKSAGYDHHEHKDSPVVLAAGQVFESASDGVSFWRGTLSGPPDSLERIAKRAGLAEIPYSLATYKDREGIVHVPFDVALEVAQKFCQAEPSTVLIDVESTERQWSSKAERGEDYIVSLLNEYRASWALLRQWAGHDAAVAQREKEIQRLERLVWDAVYALQKAGLDDEAARLRRAIDRQ